MSNNIKHSYPHKIFVEPTTRCNLTCEMCVKQAPGCGILEQDLDPKLLERLAPDLPKAKSLIFSGIGEPLLHPNISSMVRFARTHLPESARLGIQTNGMLLQPDMARTLVDAGLDLVCVSVDGLRGCASGHRSLSGPDQALAALETARREYSADRLRTGVEFVIMRSNFRELPQVLRWAGEQGCAFVLVSHLLPYTGDFAAESILNPNTDRSRQVFEEWKAIASEKGVDLVNYRKTLSKFIMTDKETQLSSLLKELLAQTRELQVPMNLSRLIAWDGINHAEIDAVLDEADEVAREWGLDYERPPLSAKFDRYCEFVEEKSTFVAADGAVSPCHFLWHDYRCHMDGADKRIRRVDFGNLQDSELSTIWNSKQFKKFRCEASEYDYPHCSNCPTVPCSDITAERIPFERDCHGAQVPCGHCVWCTGGIRCLS